ncbi:Cyclin-A3-1 [Gracilaria domingensis]|nr:Cyclin-A3-1 [Gracilaria domingensis]
MELRVRTLHGCSAARLRSTCACRARLRRGAGAGVPQRARRERVAHVERGAQRGVVLRAQLRARLNVQLVQSGAAARRRDHDADAGGVRAARRSETHPRLPTGRGRAVDADQRAAVHPADRGDGGAGGAGGGCGGVAAEAAHGAAGARVRRAADAVREGEGERRARVGVWARRGEAADGGRRGRRRTAALLRRRGEAGGVGRAAAAGLDASRGGTTVRVPGNQRGRVPVDAYVYRRDRICVPLGISGGDSARRLREELQNCSGVVLVIT